MGARVPVMTRRRSISRRIPPLLLQLLIIRPKEALLPSIFPCRRARSHRYDTYIPYSAVRAAHDRADTLATHTHLSLSLRCYFPCSSQYPGALLIHGREEVRRSRHGTGGCSRQVDREARRRKAELSEKQVFCSGRGEAVLPVHRECCERVKVMPVAVPCRKLER